MLHRVSQRRQRPEPDQLPIKLSAQVRAALVQLQGGAHPAAIAANLTRQYAELELFAVRLPLSDRRQSALSRLARAVRITDVTT